MVNRKSKILALFGIFFLTVPLTAFYLLDGSNVDFDTRSQARMPEGLPSEFVRADIAGNQKVDVGDFGLWLGFYKRFKDDEGTYTPIADLNEDGEINIEDFKLWLDSYREYKKYAKEVGLPQRSSPPDQPPSRPVVPPEADEEEEEEEIPPEPGQELVEIGEKCEEGNGTWLEQYLECEGMSRRECQELGGTYYPCASGCRNIHDPNIYCLDVCIELCSFGDHDVVIPPFFKGTAVLEEIDDPVE